MDQCEEADEKVPLLQEQRRRSQSKSAEQKRTQPYSGPEPIRVSSSAVSASPSWCCSLCCIDRPDSPEPESIPGAVPEHEPEPGLEPGQDLEPESKAPPFLLPQSKPGVQFEPVSAPELEPARERDLESEPGPAPQQESENESETGPQLRPQPESELGPEPVSAYVFTYGPVSDLKPEPEPELEPETEPAPELEPGPNPKPEPVPEPDPDSEPKHHSSSDQRHDIVISKDQDESWEDIWSNPNYTEVKLQLKVFFEDLDSRELKHFHWYLQNADQSKDGFKAIKKSRLEHADILDTVDLMVQMYTSESGAVAEKILEKMKSSKAEKNLTEVMFWEASAVPAVPAAKEKDLAWMMSDFVKRVSKENLVELMDALVDNKVLNDLEKKSVLEGNHTTVNKASGFVEIVTEKGDEACKKMIDHLQTIDSAFSTELTLPAALSTKAELRVVLVGKDGAEKSAAGYTILGKKLFDSVVSPWSCTLRSQKEEGDVLGRRVSVVDTPGLFNNQLSPDQVRAELLKAVELSSPGPHVFLFTLSVGRFTKEEERALQMLQEIFSPDVPKYIMVLFTHGDYLEEDGLVDMEEIIKESSILQKLLEDCSGQYHLFNNKKMEDRKQVQELLDKIDSISEGGRTFYKKKFHSAHDVARQLHELANEMDQRQALHLRSPRWLFSWTASSKTELRVVLVGKDGAEKSAAGNTILGKKLFDSVVSPWSCTLRSQKEEGDVLGRRVSVVDTPGLFNNQLSPDQVRAELLKAVELSFPGPHVFLFTLSVGRFTKEEERALQMLQEIFSPDVPKYIMVLFTHGDYLEEDGLVDMEEIIKESSILQKLLEDCSGQYHLFNNKKMEDRKQVQELLDKIDSISEGGRTFYKRESQRGLLGWSVIQKLFPGRSQNL